MASLFFTCPITYQQAPIGIETDVQGLRTARKAKLKSNAHTAGDAPNFRA